MDDEHVGARRNDSARHGIERLFRVLLVDADAALDGHRHVDCRLHGRDAIADELGLAHQAGAEGAALHAVGRAADIEIDLVVAEVRADGGGLRERVRLRAAELQRHRMLAPIEADQPRAVAEDDGVGGHHLGVEQRATRHEAMEEPAMPVRPIHHGGDGEEMVEGGQLGHGAVIGRTPT